MSSAKDGKAKKYIDQLYQARCDGQWRSVPELARKTEKHCPSRKCLTLAARAGALIKADPTPAGFTRADEEYGGALATVVNEDTHSDEDIFDALVCRAALRLGSEDTRAALSLLPTALHLVPAPASGQGREGWWASCIVQGTLIRGLAFESQGEIDRATETYRSFISDLAQVIHLPDLCIELRRSTEELIVHMSLYFSSAVGNKPAQLGEAMATFHLLSQFLRERSIVTLNEQGLFTKHNPKTVGKAYYEALTQIIAEGLVYHPSPVDRDHETIEHRGLLEDDEYFKSRVQQRELTKAVELDYEALLLKATRFPKATETNHEISAWIELVMSNFRVFCGPSWSDDELGSEGKAGVGRSTLDILYRAATKTFHSTQILRHLFTVHVFLGEFELAFRAFDSYVEIMDKGKARIAKSGFVEMDIDDDNTCVRFAAEAIRVNCRYGPREAAEKSLHISSILQKWLAPDPAPSLAKTSNDNSGGSTIPELPLRLASLEPETVAIAYRAIGVSQAHTARTTQNPHQRAELRRKAVFNFQSALDQGLPDQRCVETLYALALVWAELRDLPKALEHVKRALASSDEIASLNSPDGVLSSSGPDSATVTAEAPAAKKKIFPTWNLLSLLLSAREDFDIGHETCLAAFTQFEEMMDALGFNVRFRQNTADNSEIVDAKQEKRRSNTRARSTTNLLENFEKQSVLELKMTQLTILEATEGAEAAVNASHELLGLFARLFGNINDAGTGLGKRGEAINKTLPKSSSGTVKSRRPKSERKKLTRSSHGSVYQTATASARTSRPGTARSSLPIQVTTENGVTSDVESHSPEHHQHLFRHSYQSTNEKGGTTKRKAFGSLRSRKSLPNSRPSTGRSTARTSARTSERVSLEIVDEHPGASVNGERSLPIHTKQETANIRGSNPTPIMEETPSLPLIPHNLDREKLSPPISHDKQPPVQDVRLPVPHPSDHTISLAPHFLTVQNRRYNVALLVKIWLFTATLYRNALLFDDANGAIDEAQNAIERLEVDFLKEKANLKALREGSWGGGSSMEELKADVYTERGIIFAKRSQPHDAIWFFEQALLLNPDHPTATVELSNILLDIFCQIIPYEKADSALDPLNLLSSPPDKSTIGSPHRTKERTSQSSELTPPELYRIAARDRAYGLLTSLTKLGTGWDNSEAWFVLARAYEESGQLDKAKEALWWTVELEDTKPVRHWRDVNPGGYVL